MDQNPEKSCSEGACCNGFCCTKISGFGVTAGSTVILENVNIHIHCGALTAIIGPNGAGKSTLLKAVLGEIRHTGQLDFESSSGGRARPRIGYVPQQLNFDNGTPTSVLDLFKACNTKLPVWLFNSKRMRKHVTERLTMVGAEHLINRRLGALSGGELQRVLLALALDPVPNLLLLDEPVSGIDQSGMEQFYDLLSAIRRQYDLAVILVSHDLDLVAKYADSVILLNRTVLATGSPQKVYANPQMGTLFGSAWCTAQPQEERQGTL